MDSKKNKNYVEEADLQADVRTLYETGEFPERLARNLQEMVNRICGMGKFRNYTQDWKEEMKSAAVMALVKSLNEKRYDIDRPNTSMFNWATKVIFNQFYNWLASKKSKMRHEEKVREQFIMDGAYVSEEAGI